MLAYKGLPSLLWAVFVGFERKNEHRSRPLEIIGLSKVSTYLPRQMNHPPNYTRIAAACQPNSTDGKIAVGLAGVAPPALLVGMIVEGPELLYARLRGRQSDTPTNIASRSVRQH